MNDIETLFQIRTDMFEPNVSAKYNSYHTARIHVVDTAYAEIHASLPEIKSVAANLVGKLREHLF